jgi:hypothetical protein
MSKTKQIKDKRNYPLLRIIRDSVEKAETIDMADLVWISGIPRLERSGSGSG